MAIDKASWDQLWTGEQQAQPDPNESTGQPAQPPVTGSQQGVQAPPRQSLDKRGIAEQADKEANGGQENLSAGDYAMDAATGVAAGVEGFGKSIGKLANDVAGVFGAKFADDSAFDNVIKTKTWVGGLTSGVTQFALAFLPAVGVAGRIGEAVGITSKLVQGLAAGAAADFAGFTGQQAKLSNLVQQFPALQNPVTDFLASKPDDNWAEARLKNALEGLPLGAAGHMLLESLKGFKGMLIAKAAGDPEGFAKASSDAGRKVAAAMQTANDAAAGAKGATQAAGAVAGDNSLSGTAGKLGNDYIRGMDLDGASDKIMEQIKANPDKPFEVGLDDAVKTHVNYDRLITSKDVEGLQKLAQNVADKYVQATVGGKQSLAAVESTANELAETFSQNPKVFISSIASDEKGIQGVAQRLVSYRVMRNAVGDALVSSANKWLADPVAEGAADELSRLNMLSKSYLEIHKSVQFIQTEGARIPSYGRIAATGVNDFDPDKLGKLIDQTMKGGNGKLAQQQLARTIIASNGDPKSLITLFDGLANKVGSKATGVLTELHTNAILSGLSTMSTKFLSDMTNAVVLPAERMLGGAWMQNKAVMQSGGRMFLNVMQGFLDWTHMSEAAGRIGEEQGSSMSRAYMAFKKGQPLLDHMSEFDPQHAISAGNLGMSQGTFLGSAVNWIGKVVNVPQRMLAGMDELWKSVNYRAYIRDEGMRLAQNNGLQGDEFASFVNNHITEAFGKNGEGLNEAGMNYAKAATFQNDLLPNTMGKWLQDGVNQHPALRMIMPFVKTPTNIFRRAWQMTPGLNLLQQEFRNMATSADPIERATAYGRASLGGMMWTLSVGMAASGKLTGGGPSNPQEAAAQKDSGWQPYSVVVKDDNGNNQYISLKKLEPFAYMLGLAADWSAAAGQVKDEDGDKMTTAMLYAMAKNLSSKSYFNGVTELINALSQPDNKIQSYIQNFAGSWVPSLIAKSDDDPNMRECKGMMDAITRRIPGLSNSLPPVRNILGEPVKAPAGWLPFGGDESAAARMMSPFAGSKQMPDAVHKEIANLQYGFAKAPRSYQGFDLTSFHNKDGQDAYDRFQELHGEAKVGGQTMSDALSKLVQSQRYQAMQAPDRHGDGTNPRVMAVRQVIADYHGRAMQQTLREYPQIGKAMQAYRQQGKAPVTPSPIIQQLATK